MNDLDAQVAFLEAELDVCRSLYGQIGGYRDGGGLTGQRERAAQLRALLVTVRDVRTYLAEQNQVFT